MESRKFRKLFLAANEYAAVQLGLNYYMYCDMIGEGIWLEEHLLPLSEELFRLLEGFLTDSCTEQEISGLRSRIIEEMERATAYTDSFQAYEYVLNRMEGRFKEKKPKNTGNTDEERITRIMQYVSAARDAAETNQRTQEIMGQLPVRLTKQKFFSLVEEAMSVYEGMTEEALDEILYILRAEALLNAPERAESGYEELFAILEQMRKADYRQLSGEEYTFLKGRMEEAGRLLMDMTEKIVILTELVNRLYILFLTRPYTDRPLMNQWDETLLSGLLRWMKDGAQGETPQELTEVLHYMEGRQEDAYERWLAGGDLLDKASEDTGEEKALIYKLQCLMSASFFMELKRSEGNNRIVDKKCLQERLEAFFAELGEAWKKEPKVLVRASMAKVLSGLPPFFKTFELFREYVKGSLESCTDEYEKQACMDILETLISENSDEI